MHAFIARPFGTRNGIDFEAIEKALIGPALESVGLGWGTTQKILEAGNIREDMFRLLLTADVVVVDITLHNANVFYELGIRHALRDRRTYMIRAAGAEKQPFDLQTDRYLEYDANAPAESVDRLARALRQTLASDRADSPVFAMLPELPPQDPHDLVLVPAGFTEEVSRAARNRETGDLAMLAEEANRFPWAEKGLRVVGRAQFRAKSWEPVHRTWERVRDYDRYDYEANHALATIYQKLARAQSSADYLTRSDQAVERALGGTRVFAWERAELSALRASNAKSRWREDWWDAPEPERAPLALRSPWLREAYELYRAGFLADQNHFYSGLNALGLLTIRVELARKEPAVWSSLFESDEAADDEVSVEARTWDRLAAAVELSMAGAQPRLEYHKEDTRWLEISKADFACLTSDRPEFVANLYRRALRDAAGFYASAAGAQLDLYLRLRVRAGNTGAALAVVEEMGRGEAGGHDAPSRVLVFTGHRVDAPDRPVVKRRFPGTPEAVAAAREMISRAIREECENVDGPVLGIGGGGSGGDILFHEACRDGMPECGGPIVTRLFLAAPRDVFVRASVADGGPEWVERFNRLYEQLDCRILDDTAHELELPRWLSTLEDYSLWQRSNVWMLQNALAYGASRVTLIALWNGEAGDGPGGTADMVSSARQRGAKVLILPAQELVKAQG